MYVGGQHDSHQLLFKRQTSKLGCFLCTCTCMHTMYLQVLYVQYDMMIPRVLSKSSQLVLTSCTQQLSERVLLSPIYVQYVCLYAGTIYRVCVYFVRATAHIEHVQCILQVSCVYVYIAGTCTHAHVRHMHVPSDATLRHAACQLWQAELQRYKCRSMKEVWSLFASVESIGRPVRCRAVPVVRTSMGSVWLG